MGKAFLYGKSGGSASSNLSIYDTKSVFAHPGFPNSSIKKGDMVYLEDIPMLTDAPPITNFISRGNIVSDTDIGNVATNFAISPNNDFILVSSMYPFLSCYAIIDNEIFFIENVQGISNRVNKIVFTYEGKYAVIGCEGYALKLYRVSGCHLEYISEIYADNDSSAFTTWNDFEFSANSSFFFVSGNFTEKVKIYSFNFSNGSVTYLNGLEKSPGVLWDGDERIYMITACKNKNLLFVNVSSNTGEYVRVYNTNNSDCTFRTQLYMDGVSADFDSYINKFSTSDGGGLLIISGDFSKKAVVYRIDGSNNITYVDQVYANNSSAEFDSTKDVTAVFVPESDSNFVLSCFDSYDSELDEDYYKLKFYQVTATINFIQNVGTTYHGVTFDMGGTGMISNKTYTEFHKLFFAVDRNRNFYTYSINAYNNGLVFRNNKILLPLPNYNASSEVNFTPTKSNMVAGEMWYSIDNCTVKSTNKLFEVISRGRYPEITRFYPNDNYFLSAYMFDNATGTDFEVQLYSLNETNHTYVSNIYSDSLNNILFSSRVKDIVFSANNQYCIIFSYKFAKLYYVVGNTITYIRDVFNEAELPASSSSYNIENVRFSNDNHAIIMQTSYDGSLIYSLNNNVTTFVERNYSIYGWHLNFYSNGNYFSDGFGLFSISGTTINKIGTLYADLDNNTFDNYSRFDVKFFNSDMHFIVCGGYYDVNSQFVGYAKLYSFTDTSVTYIRDFYMDNNNTPFTAAVRGINFFNYDNCFIANGSFGLILYSDFPTANLLLDSVQPNTYKEIGYASSDIDTGTWLLNVQIINKVKTPYDEDLISSNIKEDINIFGVNGSFAGTPSDPLAAQKQGILFATLLG